jgi:hypothetical protein
LFGDGHRFSLGGLKAVLTRGLITCRVADRESQEKGHCDCYGEDPAPARLSVAGWFRQSRRRAVAHPHVPPATARYTNVGFLAGWRDQTSGY